MPLPLAALLYSVAPPCLQRKEVRQQGLRGWGVERGVDVRVDRADQALQRIRLLCQRVERLPCPHHPVLAKRLEPSVRIDHGFAVGGVEGRQIRQAQHPLQRREVVRQIAFRWHDDRARPGHHGVTGEEGPFRRVVERKVVGGVPRRVEHVDQGISQGNRVAIRQGAIDPKPGVVTEEHHRRPQSLGQLRSERPVVGVSVTRNYRADRGVAHGRDDAVGVAVVARFTGVENQQVGGADQMGIGARAGERSRVLLRDATDRRREGDGLAIADRRGHGRKARSRPSRSSREMSGSPRS